MFRVLLADEDRRRPKQQSLGIDGGLSARKGDRGFFYARHRFFNLCHLCFHVENVVFDVDHKVKFIVRSYVNIVMQTSMRVLVIEDMNVRM